MSSWASATFLREKIVSRIFGTEGRKALDVSNDDSINAAVRRLETAFAKVDVLINNAGIEIKKPHPTREDLRTTFETNVFGPTVLTQELSPSLQASKSAKVINVTSELGSITQRSDPNHYSYHVPHTSYRMSNSALNMLTACQYKDMKEHGVQVFLFCPGYVIKNLTGEIVRSERILGRELRDQCAGDAGDC